MGRKPKPRVKLDLSNYEAVKAAARESIETILEHENDRAAINAKISAERKKLKALGVPPAAVNLAKAHYQLDQEKRREIDEGYALVRDALGIPFAPIDLDAAPEPEMEEAE